MVTTFVNMLAPLAIWIINNYLGNQASKTGNLKNFLEWIEFASNAQLMTQDSRRRAVDQVERIKKLWEVKRAAHRKGSS